jgi:NAD+ synthase
MPYKNSHPDSLAHAVSLAKFLGIEYYEYPVTEMVDAYFDWFESDASNLRRANRIARERMCILYDLSAKHKALVVGTCNKSEIWTGYCTIHGDSASAFEPIAHLYKCEVFQMAKTISIPNCIIEKSPSADLWDGQTDEDDLGITYAELDKILYYHIDEKKNQEDILKHGISREMYDLVLRKINASAFKRCLPITIQNIWEI